MHELKAADRDAILLRYFENHPFAEVGAKLGLNDNAARMRVERALEKLRAIFAKRGVATTTALAAAISADAVQLAPANLASTLAATAISTAATGGFTIMKMLTAAKLKLAFGAIIVSGAATMFVVQEQNQAKLRGENVAWQLQINQLQTDNQNLSNRLASAGDAQKLTKEQFNELLKLRGEVGVLRRQLEDAGNLRAENQQLRAAAAKLRGSIEGTGMSSVQAKFDSNQVYMVNAMKQLGLAVRLYANDHGDLYATNFDQIANELGEYERGGLYKNPILTNVDFVNVGVVNGQHPQMILFRERQARQAPDGTWHRIYGLSDGSVQTATSPAGNFDAWEKYDYNENGIIFLAPQNPN
jgi:hypothetical protein